MKLYISSESNVPYGFDSDDEKPHSTDEEGDAHIESADSLSIIGNDEGTATNRRDQCQDDINSPDNAMDSMMTRLSNEWMDLEYPQYHGAESHHDVRPHEHLMVDCRVEIG